MSFQDPFTFATSSSLLRPTSKCGNMRAEPVTSSCRKMLTSISAVSSTVLRRRSCGYAGETVRPKACSRFYVSIVTMSRASSMTMKPRSWSSSEDRRRTAREDRGGVAHRLSLQWLHPISVLVYGSIAAASVAVPTATRWFDVATSDIAVSSWASTSKDEPRLRSATGCGRLPCLCPQRVVNLL